jgi:hypothetical protein
MNDKEFSDSVHMNIHAVRLLPGYKATEFEKKISKLVIDKFSDTCSECRSVGENIKNQKPNKSFFKKLGEVIIND